MRLIVKNLGLCDYQNVWQKMQAFTNQRDAKTVDELWLLEHHPIFTQGQNGKAEHILHPGTIPVIQSDRGGQITYHGPGQLITYVLIDLRRKKLGIRPLVSALENILISQLASYNIQSHAKSQAPGVYINNAKVASLGLRVRRGSSFHGMSLNVDMDLEPFSRIHPCGYHNLKMTQVSDHGGPKNIELVGKQFVKHFAAELGYNDVILESQK